MTGFIDIETTQGVLRAVAAPRVTSLLGVRYAEAARFEAPRPPQPWAGVRQATVFGPGSPQGDPRLDASAEYYEVLRLLYPGVPTPLEGRTSGEDCLYLNVWTPAADDARRPVMVWLHGGGYVHGTGAEGWFQGDRLAAEGELVVVTLNHRLGIFGFLGSDETHPDSGVLGMLDIVEALRWVRDNIASLGGNPDNVTIFGQSGGGSKVSTLMAMPTAQGLFHKAIVQSGPGLAAITQSAATATRLQVVERLRELGTSLAAATTEQLLEVQHELVSASGMLSFGPVLHDVHLPHHPFADGAPVAADRIPLLIGSTTHEYALMLSEQPWYHRLTSDQLPDRFAQFFGDDAEAALEHYRALEGDTVPQLVLARATTDFTFRSPLIRMREAKAQQQAPVYAYRLDYRTEVLGGILGAHHSLDLAFVFGNVDRSPVTGSRVERFGVSRAMVAAWSSFARTGDPATPLLPEWPEFGAAGEVLVFAEQPFVEVDAALPAFRSAVSLGA